MHEEFKEIGKYILKKVESSVSYADVRVHKFRFLVVKTENRRLKEIEAKEKYSVALRVMRNGKTGFASVTGFDKKSLNELISNAFSSLRASCASFELSERECERAEVSSRFKLHPSEFPLDEKISICEELNKLAITSRRIIYSETWLGEMEDIRYFSSTDGADLLTTFISTGVRQTSIAKENGKIQKVSETKSHLGGYEFVYTENWNDFVREISFLSEKMLYSSPPPAGEMTVIFDPKSIGLLLHESLGHACEADLVFSGSSVLQDMIGKKIASEKVSVYDSGIEESGVFVPYDDEGVKKERTKIIENGVLKSLLHSRETAAKFSTTSTGNARAESAFTLPMVRQTNFFMAPGDYKVEELIEDTKKGIYVSGIGAKGGEANVSTGLFTFTSGPCYLIENGEIKKLLAQVPISGFVTEVLSSIDAVANDFSLHFNIFFGCKKEGQRVKVGFGGPHVRVNKVIVGGV